VVEEVVGIMDPYQTGVLVVLVVAVVYQVLVQQEHRDKEVLVEIQEVL
jgi:hypothetical protein